MGKWQTFGCVVSPALDRHGQRGLFPIAQAFILGVTANQERQLDVAQLVQQTFMPERRAFFSGRQISATPGPGIAKAHRHNRHLGGIVKVGRGDPHPTAKTLTAGVIPGDTGLMDSDPGSLADQKDASLCTRRQHRSRLEMGLAGSALPDLDQQ